MVTQTGSVLVDRYRYVDVFVSVDPDNHLARTEHPTRFCVTKGHRDVSEDDDKFISKATKDVPLVAAGRRRMTMQFPEVSSEPSAYQHAELAFRHATKAHVEASGLLSGIVDATQFAILKHAADTADRAHRAAYSAYLAVRAARDVGLLSP